MCIRDRVGMVVDEHLAHQLVGAQVVGVGHRDRSFSVWLWRTNGSELAVAGPAFQGPAAAPTPLPGARSMRAPDSGGWRNGPPRRCVIERCVLRPPTDVRPTSALAWSMPLTGDHTASAVGGT